MMSYNSFFNVQADIIQGKSTKNIFPYDGEEFFNPDFIAEVKKYPSCPDYQTPLKLIFGSSDKVLVFTMKPPYELVELFESSNKIFQNSYFVGSLHQINQFSNSEQFINSFKFVIGYQESIYNDLITPDDLNFSWIPSIIVKVITTWNSYLENKYLDQITQKVKIKSEKELVKYIEKHPHDTLVKKNYQLVKSIQTNDFKQINNLNSGMMAIFLSFNSLPELELKFLVQTELKKMKILKMLPTTKPTKFKIILNNHESRLIQMKFIKSLYK